MKLTHFQKAIGYYATSGLIFLGFITVLLFSRSIDVAWAVIPVAPLCLYLSWKGADHLGQDFAEAVGQGISKGINNYFNSDAFPKAMDDAFTSACSSLAAEAEAVGQTDLAAGYKVLGGVQPAPKNWWQIQEERKARQGGYLAFADTKGPAYLGFKELCGSLHKEDKCWHLFDIKRAADGSLESATIVPKDHAGYKENSQAVYDLVCNEFHGRGAEMCEDIDITKEVADRLIAIYESQVALQK